MLPDYTQLTLTGICDPIYDAAARLMRHDVDMKDGIKVARARARKELMNISKLCKSLRKQINALNVPKPKTQEDNLEKYAVDETVEDATKVAATAFGLCPKCGATLELHGDVKLCPVHGSEPFEL